MKSNKKQIGVGQGSLEVKIFTGAGSCDEKKKEAKDGNECQQGMSGGPIQPKPPFFYGILRIHPRVQNTVLNQETQTNQYQEINDRCRKPALALEVQKKPNRH